MPFAFIMLVSIFTLACSAFPQYHPQEENFVFDSMPSVKAAGSGWTVDYDVNVYDDSQTVLVIPFACEVGTTCEHSPALLDGSLNTIQNVGSLLRASTWHNDGLSDFETFATKPSYTRNELLELQVKTSTIGKTQQDESWIMFSASSSLLHINYRSSSLSAYAQWSDVTALFTTKVGMLFIMMPLSGSTTSVIHTQYHEDTFLLQKPAVLSASFDVRNDCVVNGYSKPNNGLLEKRAIHGSLECTWKCYQGYIRDPFNNLAQMNNLQSHSLQRCFKPPKEHVSTIVTASLRSTRNTLSSAPVVSTTQLAALDTVAAEMSEKLETNGFLDVHVFCKMVDSVFDDSSFNVALQHTVGMYKLHEDLSHEMHVNNDFIFSRPQEWPMLVSCLITTSSMNAQPYSMSYSSRQAFFDEAALLHQENWNIEQVDVEFVSRLAFTVKYESAKVNVYAQRVAIWCLECAALLIAGRIYFRKRRNC